MKMRFGYVDVAGGQVHFRQCGYLDEAEIQPQGEPDRVWREPMSLK
jgi:hypothetical protein